MKTYNRIVFLFSIFLAGFLGILVSGYSAHKVLAVNPPTLSTSCGSTTDTYGKKDMHVWHDADIKKILEGGQLRTDLFNFIDTHGVGRIYLSLPASILQSSVYKVYLKDFLNILKKDHCATVLALAGDSTWVAVPNSSTVFTVSGSVYKTTAAVDWVNAVKVFNSGLSLTDTKIVGVHADVEPYTLTCKSLTGGSGCNYPGWSPVWNTNTNAVANAFLDMLKQMKTAAGTTLTLEADIPYWFDVSENWPVDGARFNRVGYGTGKSLAKWVIDMTNSVTLMDYFTDPAKIYSHAVGEMTYAKSIGKTVKIGVNTINSDSGNGVNTFWTKTCSDLNNALGTTYNSVKINNLSNGFGGFSIHMWRAKVNNSDPTDRAYWDLCPQS